MKWKWNRDTLCGGLNTRTDRGEATLTGAQHHTRGAWPTLHSAANRFTGFNCNSNNKLLLFFFWKLKLSPHWGIPPHITVQPVRATWCLKCVDRKTKIWIRFVGDKLEIQNDPHNHLAPEHLLWTLTNRKQTQNTIFQVSTLVNVGRQKLRIDKI